MKEVAGYIGLLRGALGAHKTYIHSLENSDMFGKTYVPEAKPKDKDEKVKPKLKPEIESIKKMIGGIQELHGKLTADLPFAKREIAYGKLTPDDLETLFKQLRAIMMPVLGLSSVMDLFERAAELNHWSDDDDEPEHDEQRKKAVSEWNDMFQYLHDPFSEIFKALDDGLAHVLLKLGLSPLPKKRKKGQAQNDEEAKGDSIRPGDSGFAEHLEKQARIFFSKKEPTLRHWIKSKGINISSDYFSSANIPDEDEETLKRLPSLTTRKRDQRQLYVLLYVMFLLNSIGRSTLELVKFADEHDPATTKNKLIWPGAKRFKKWLRSIFTSQDTTQDDETTVSSNTTVYLGDAYKHKKDPEHLPPANAWESFGNGVRSVSHFLQSPESAFGFRAACATMSIAIMAFLRSTQTFFVEQRLVWALIMVAISMTPTAGQSVFQFSLRIAGTAIAMVVAWLIWYIPGQHTAGILVFLFLFVAIGFYVPLKRIDLVIAGLISVVTATMIVGYDILLFFEGCGPYANEVADTSCKLERLVLRPLLRRRGSQLTRFMNWAHTDWLLSLVVLLLHSSGRCFHTR
jgi:ABC-type multidrug transport system permease subunit